MDFTVEFVEKTVGVFVVFPKGSLDANTSQTLEQKVNYLLDNAARVIIFDLTDLTYISSAGVRVFLATKKEMQKRNGEFHMLNLQPQIEKVFQIIKALPSMSVFKNIEEMDLYLDRMQKRVIDQDE